MFKTVFKLACIAIIFTLNACKSTTNSGKIYKDQVIVHALSDLQGLNLATSSDGLSSVAGANIFQSLMQYSSETLELIPVLAKAEQEVVTTDKGRDFIFEIREQAKWPNGSPVLASDILFSWKAVYCPGVNTTHLRPYLDFVYDIELYDDNPRKIKFKTDQIYMLADYTVGSLSIQPKYVYDKEGLLDNFTFPELKIGTGEIAQNPLIKKFAKQYNSDEYARDTDKVVGSGAYKLARWDTDQRVILEKKENWWGHALETENQYFEAYPKRIIYEVINDINTALVAVKDEKVDVMFVTPVKEYMDLDKSDKFNSNYIKSEPPTFIYTYLGLNVGDKILKDKKVREALAYLTDIDKINDKLLYGQQERIIGDILPVFEKDYNNDIKPRQYDPEKGAKLLDEAGWQDKDGDGIREKEIEGEKTDLVLTYNFNTGNSTRENVGLMIQNWWKQAGIKVEVVGLDWSLYGDELKNNNVQLWYQGWISSPSPSDPKQLWHTSSKNGGSNFSAFGNAESDALIDKIRTELNEDSRSVLYKEWQQLLHDELPAIFLFTQKSRNVIHKRFENIRPSALYPGYWVAGFKVKEEYQIQE